MRSTLLSLSLLLLLAVYSLQVDLDLNPRFIQMAEAKTEDFFLNCQKDIMGIFGNENIIRCYFFGRNVENLAYPIASIETDFGACDTIVKHAYEVSPGNSVSIYEAKFPVTDGDHPQFSYLACEITINDQNARHVHTSTQNVIMSMMHRIYTFEEDASLVYVAGDNAAHQLDPASTKKQLDKPEVLKAPFNGHEGIVQVASCDSTFVVTDQGELWSLGGSYYPGHNGDTTVWTQIDTKGYSIMSAACGEKHAAFRGFDEVLRQTAVLTVGKGDATGIPYADRSPHHLTSIAMFLPLDVAEVECGLEATYVRTGAGEVMAAGSNQYGELGSGNTDPSVAFVQVVMPDGFGTVTQLGKPAGQSMHVMSGAGRVVAFGRNHVGQLGLGIDDKIVTVPALVGGTIENVIIRQVVSGIDFALALNDNNKVYGAGADKHIAVDTKTGDHTQFVLSIAIDQTYAVAEMAAGEEHAVAVAIDTNGVMSVLVWGNNDAGQLGVGTDTAFVTAPTKFALPAKGHYTRVFAGDKMTGVYETTDIKDAAFVELYGNGMVQVASTHGSVGQAELHSISDQTGAIGSPIHAVELSRDLGIYYFWSTHSYPIPHDIFRFTIVSLERQTEFRFDIPASVNIQPAAATEVSWHWSATDASWTIHLDLVNGAFNPHFSSVAVDCMGETVASFDLHHLSFSNQQWYITLHAPFHIGKPSTPLSDYYPKCKLVVDTVELYTGPIGSPPPLDLTTSSLAVDHISPFVVYGGRLTMCIVPRDSHNRFIPMDIADLQQNVKFQAVYPTTVSSETTDTLEPFPHLTFFEKDDMYCESVDTNFPVSGQLQVTYKGKIVGEEVFMVMRCNQDKSLTYLKGFGSPQTSAHPVTFCVKAYDVMGITPIVRAPDLAVEIVVSDQHTHDRTSLYAPFMPDTSEYCATTYLSAGTYRYAAYYNGLQELKGGRSFTIIAAPLAESTGYFVAHAFEVIVGITALLCGMTIATLGLVVGAAIAVAGGVYCVMAVKKAQPAGYGRIDQGEDEFGLLRGVDNADYLGEDAL